MIIENLIMDLYLLEFFIEKFDIGSNNKVKNIDFHVHVTCSDFFKMLLKNVKKNGVGKASVFSCDRTKLISGFSSDFRALITTEDSETTVGSAKLSWPNDFEDRVGKMDKRTDNIQHTGSFKIIDEESKPVGAMQIKMCLAYFGATIEILINDLGSQIYIPLNFRTKTMNDEWLPTFQDPKKPLKSVVDSQFYQNISAVQPQPITDILTPEYIKNNLCGRKTCPGVQNFKKFGLGPLATEGSWVPIIDSSEKSKPCGLCDISQAHVSKDYYGPSFAEDIPKKCQCTKQNSKGSTKGTSNCGSPKCPKLAPKGSNACPYSTRKVGSSCGSINCPYSTPKVNNTCEAANCAYNPIVDSTCGTPNCPKCAPKEGVPCPYSKKSRLSAGADRYNTECNQSCLYSTYKQRRKQTSTANSKRNCGGRVCPLLPRSNYEEHLTVMDDFAKEFCEDSPVKQIKFTGYEVESESEKDEIELKPTLIIEKKQGNYLITMNPYMTCKPMLFLIIKPKKEVPPIITKFVEYKGEDDGKEEFVSFYNPCTYDGDSRVFESSTSLKVN